MDTFVAVIEAFGGTEPFGEAAEVPDSHARAMKARKSIPPLYWPRIVTAAQSKGIEGISYEMLAKLAEKIALERGKSSDPAPEPEPAEAPQC